MGQIYSISINDIVYLINVEEKKRKNALIKITNNQINIFGYHITKKKALKLVEKYQDWILKQIDQANRQSSYFNLLAVSEFKKIWLFGSLYDISIQEEKKGYSINNVFFPILYPINELSYDKEIKRIREYFSKEVLKRFEYFNSLFSKNTSITFKNMRSKYGYCLFKDNKIVLAINLIHFPWKIIDYIIIHEFCHFQEPNHSKRFYHEVEKYCPDYKTIIKELKFYGILTK